MLMDGFPLSSSANPKNRPSPQQFLESNSGPGKYLGNEFIAVNLFLAELAVKDADEVATFYSELPEVRAQAGGQKLTRAEIGQAFFCLSRPFSVALFLSFLLRFLIFVNLLLMFSGYFLLLCRFVRAFIVLRISILPSAAPSPYPSTIRSRFSL